MTRYVVVYQLAITVAYLVVLGHSYEFGTPENPCGREPADIDLPKRDGWNGYSIVLEGYVYPTTYVPGKTYQVTLRSTPPVSFKGFNLIANRVEDSERSAGEFRILDAIQTELQPGCPHAIKDHAPMTKTRITVEWTAPPAGTGCIVFRATVVQRKKVWFMDDGALSLELCEGEVAQGNNHDASLDCCACGSPKYKVTFQGLWSRRTHPKDFPGGYGDHWSDLIGASHTKEYTVWEYGGYSTLGVKQVAELGSPIALEREIRAQGGNIKTVITAPGLWPAVGNMTALFRTNRSHNLVSVLSMIGPSPDWCVGVSRVNLCTEDCSWEEMKVIDLYPWDAGTDSGVSFRSGNAPTRPQEPIHPITSQFPANEAAGFYDLSGAPILPLARLHLERIELRDMSCDSNGTYEDEELNRGGGMMIKPGMVKPGMSKPPMMPPKPGMMNKDNPEGEEGETVMPHKPMMATNATMPPKQMPPKQMPPKEMPSATQMPPKQMPPKVMPGTDETVLTNRTMPPKHRPGRPVIDCMMSEFGPWSECSKSCGKGTMIRKRMIKQKQKNGGEPCGRTKEKKKCTMERCPRAGNRDRDCMMTEWGDWFPCSVSCGEGAQKRMRQVKRRAKGNGAPCEPALEERVCFNPPCER